MDVNTRKDCIYPGSVDKVFLVQGLLFSKTAGLNFNDLVRKQPMIPVHEKDLFFREPEFPAHFQQGTVPKTILSGLIVTDTDDQPPDKLFFLFRKKIHIQFNTRPEGKPVPFFLNVFFKQVFNFFVQGMPEKEIVYLAVFYHAENPE